MDLSIVIFFLLSLVFMILSQKTDEDYGECRSLFTHNYGYKIYFHIPKGAILSDNNTYFNFSVKTASDAHILFSSIPNPKDSDALYEIVIGGGWNTFSDIRRLHSKSFRVTNITRGIVNKNLFKKFWIQLNDGLIMVGEGGSSSPFLKHLDREPLKVNFISFSSWHGANAAWLFDCGDPTPLPEIVLNRTASERLRNQLFRNYDPYVTPISDDDFIVVYSNLTINYIYLDPARSSMDVRGMLRVSWVDFKLQWNPFDYENIEIIRLTERKIWQPDFLLYNGATLHQKWFEDGIVIINYIGEVTWTTPVHLTTRCNVKLDEWPRDEHSCKIQIGLLNSQQRVNLTGLVDINLDNENDASVWEIISVEGDKMLVFSPWDESVPEEINSNINNISSVLTVEIKMRRYPSTYYYLFYIPLKATIVMSVVSFILPYTCPQRVVMQMIVLINYVINLLSIASALPSIIRAAPNILSLNCGLFMVALVGTLLTMGLIQLSHSEKYISVPLILEKFIKISTIRMNHFSNNNRGQKLLNLEDEDEEAEPSISKMTKQENKFSEKQKSQAFMLTLDYLLLTMILISYSILIILF